MLITDQKLKEQQASLILEKHEREEKENLIINLKTELDRLQNKHQSLIKENNDLSVKVNLKQQIISLKKSVLEIDGTQKNVFFFANISILVCIKKGYMYKKLE